MYASMHYSICQGHMHMCTDAMVVTDIGVLFLQGSDACNDGAIQIQHGLLNELNVCLYTHITQHHLSILGTW